MRVTPCTECSVLRSSAAARAGDLPAENVAAAAPCGWYLRIRPRPELAFCSRVAAVGLRKLLRTAQVKAAVDSRSRACPASRDQRRGQAQDCGCTLARGSAHMVTQWQASGDQNASRNHTPKDDKAWRTKATCCVFTAGCFPFCSELEENLRKLLWKARGDQGTGCSREAGSVQGPLARDLQAAPPQRAGAHPPGHRDKAGLCPAAGRGDAGARRSWNTGEE